MIDNNRLVPDGTLFFPQYLQKAGYATGFIGKWHMGGHHDDQVQKIAGSKPRNVVFILSDDHRYDAMSFMGHQFAETPHLDSLASNGVHFENAFVTTSLCSPSRASILTGLYTFRHRVIDNNRLVPDGTLFFPQYLQKAGYATGFIGKWHMGGHHDDPRPGFDYWVSFKGQGNYFHQTRTTQSTSMESECRKMGTSRRC